MKIYRLMQNWEGSSSGGTVCLNSYSALTKAKLAAERAQARDDTVGFKKWGFAPRKKVWKASFDTKWALRDTDSYGDYIYWIQEEEVE